MCVALVTGASGFLGGYVCSELRKREFKVIRLVRSAEPGEMDDAVVMPPTLRASEVAQMIDGVSPEVVYHLGGTSRSENILALYQANVFYADALLQGALASRSRPSVLLVGSAAEYGVPTSPEMSVREEDFCRPVTAYGISKLAQTHHGLAAASKGLSVKIARLFNPIGVGAPESSALGSFVKQVAAIRTKGLLTTGKLGSVRDFIDVAHAARIIVDLPSLGSDSEHIYNVCTGRGLSLGDLVSRLIDVSKADVVHEIDPTRAGTSDVDTVVGDTTRLRQAGLEIPHTEIDRILQDMLAVERKRIGVSRA